MIVKIFLVNALVDGLFSGGKAGVVILRHLGQEVFLQALATEMGLPVTAYVLPYNEAFMVRYFTPQREVENADYAALAAAQALFGAGMAPVTRPLTLLGHGGRRQIVCDPLDQGRLALELDRPASVQAAAQTGDQAVAALGLDAGEIAGLMAVGESELIICCRETGPLHQAASAGRGLIPPEPFSGLTLSAPLEAASGDGEAGYALCSFNQLGEQVEVPVDLSPHAILAPFWAERLNQRRLTVHHLADRTCLFRAETAEDGTVTVSGLMNTILRADPVLDELTGELPSDLASF